jgi:hypothetical protein
VGFLGGFGRIGVAIVVSEWVAGCLACNIETDRHDVMRGMTVLSQRESKETGIPMEMIWAVQSTGPQCIIIAVGANEYMKASAVASYIARHVLAFQMHAVRTRTLLG